MKNKSLSPNTHDVRDNKYKLPCVPEAKLPQIPPVRNHEGAVMRTEIALSPEGPPFVLRPYIKTERREFCLVSYADLRHRHEGRFIRGAAGFTWQHRSVMLIGKLTHRRTILEVRTSEIIGCEAVRFDRSSVFQPYLSAPQATKALLLEFHP